MPIKFPYLRKITDTGLIITPYCWLEIRTGGNTWRKQKFLFDTGADYTSVPRFMSTIVGLDIATLKKETMYVANNDAMSVYGGHLSVRLGELEFNLPCMFTDRDDTPFLLGRAGLIDRFEMLLSAKHKALIFE